ncbi:MAG TPA: Asp-tRNA(Asn)/Glu-tRNA(Gln) amidotransferase subunit GatB [Anaerolineales bacterium]|nr:Asp-tRNA(Asn)/Glu-tRNA(Gln) amidotransferase subunit GatB [Anaerolineales bacterium]
MTTYEPVIGLEIHAELQTKSKMFCGCSAAYSEAPAPNTLVCPVCTALPGAMPVVNAKAVEQAILVGLALNCAINPMNQFARKNYFYPDLPKGYQISQYDLPVASDGWLDILEESAPQRVRVRRAHLEEDTAKLAHSADGALVDYNRAGVPLLEIVSEPDMHTVEAALAYGTKIRAILRYLGVNSGDMEKGVLRFEANVSVRPAGSDELRTRTEIKNLNSFRALTRASAYEIQRQTKIYETGGEVVQETLGWDDVKGVTVSQRSKEEAHDYRYFPEPDLPPLDISREHVEEIRARLPELPEAKTGRFVSAFGLTAKEARLLTSEKSLADYFEKAVAAAKSPAKTINNWIAGEFLRHVNELGLEIEGSPVPPAALAGLADLVTAKTINDNTAKEVLAEMFTTGQTAEAIVKAKNLGQISDASALEAIVAQILADNPKEVASYLAGKETVFQWMMGQVARLTKGKADPQVARQLLQQALEKEKNKS